MNQSVGDIYAELLGLDSAVAIPERDDSLETQAA